MALGHILVKTDCFLFFFVFFSFCKEMLTKKVMLKENNYYSSVFSE